MATSAQEHFGSLEDLFVHQLEDIYDAEKRLTSALPKMRDAASNQQLKDAFSHHLEETQGHVSRLDKVFQELGKQPQRETCPAMQGLIKEGEEMIQSQADSATHDAALIAAAQRVEHYEMAAYGTARTLANRLQYREMASQLEATLNEEKSADSKLNDIAESHVHPQASH